MSEGSTSAAQFAKPAPKASEAPQYYYWHNKVATGEQAAPPPSPQLLKAETIAPQAPELVRNIDKYLFLDDDVLVKVYIELEGDLAGVTAAQVQSQFTHNTLLVQIQGHRERHQLWVDKLMHDVTPQKCKIKVSKQGKLIIAMQKSYQHNSWGRLRAR